MLVRPLVVVAVGFVASFAACASGSDEGDEPASAPSVTSAATTTTSGQGGSSSGTGGSSSTTGSGGSGAGGPMCDVSQKLCGGICIDPSPANGCAGSAACDPCPQPPLHGMATCDLGGQCDVECDAPYVPMGSSCSCPTECCGNEDCASGEVCDNGACTTDCSPGGEGYAACTLLCAAMNKLCRTDGVCDCM